MFNISLEQGYGFTTMAAVAAAAILFTAAFYYRAFKRLQPWRRWTLFALRSAAILIVVLLLFRPVFSYYRNLEERKPLVLLLDSSSSMNIADDATGRTRFDRARDRIAQWWEKLQDDFDLQLIEFAQRARPIDDIEQLAELTPEGKATSLVTVVDAPAKKCTPGEVEGVVMFSDGVHNSAGDPVKTAGKLGMVVHTVGVGASLRSDVSYRDIQVTAIDCQDRLMLNNLAKITASVEGIGLEGRVIQVILEEDERQIEQAELTLDGIEGAQPVTFEFRPTTKGRHTYTTRVPAAAEEKIEENNNRSAVALVVEPGIRVLYVEGTVRAEYGALVQRFLAKDPDLEFYALVQTRPNFFIKRTNIPDLELKGIPSDKETIDRFDVFIFGDLDASYIRQQQQELFVDRINEGAGIVMLGGYHSLGPGGWAGTPIGNILPVRLGGREIGQITESFLPVLTPDGVRHPIFANISGFFPTAQGPAKIDGLPLLDGCTTVEGARPGATVLATFSAASGTMPVLAVQPVGRGRVAVFCGDTTRKWQQGPRATDRQSPFLQFWGQMVRWLAGREVAVQIGESISGGTDKGYYEPAEQIVISAVVRDQEGEGARNAPVVANIRGPAGRLDKITLSVAPGPAGHYGGTFEPKTSGTFEITIETRLGEKTLSTDKLVVEVGRPNLEFERLDLDEELLGRIAAAAGGRYVHITTADYLIEQFDRSLQKKRIYIERRLYWPPLFWVLFVGVLTTEWILRRRFQLR